MSFLTVYFRAVLLCDSIAQRDLSIIGLNNRYTNFVFKKHESMYASNPPCYPIIATHLDGSDLSDSDLLKLQDLLKQR